MQNLLFDEIKTCLNLTTPKKMKNSSKLVNYSLSQWFCMHKKRNNMIMCGLFEALSCRRFTK